ncbi:RNase III domain-containing protein [Xylariomycetidae sp. FL0641]|nr:RNase III domain-containing protein [Xylariomycetidae sp. FL0641]
MALNTTRSAASLSRQALRQCRTLAAGLLCRPLASSSCSFATTASCSQEQTSTSELPRWSYTPERMKAPFSPHITKDPSRSIWQVNEDPRKLDDALSSFLGRDGEKMLPEELKWLAVTHKSFDQGRRGFNDRLAFLGRQMAIMEVTQSIITSAPKEAPVEDPYADRRQPFEDPALRTVDNLTMTQPNDILTLPKLAKIAEDTSLVGVVRWKPRMPENIRGSGFQPVMAGAIYAIVGAIALQHGGKAASRVIRERILKKLR